jgi:aminoglycoside phosphotransferase family enzyme/predicted kinase
MGPSPLDQWLPTRDPVSVDGLVPGLFATTPAARVAETHSAWVVFLGDRAYKVKKPVRLDFLDFTTREARERALQRELELNRRLAPDVYLAVGDVSGPDGVPCDHLLVMRRMPDDRRLSALVDRDEDIDDDVRAIARVVAAFHAAAPTSSVIASVATVAVIRDKVTRDLDEMDAFVPHLLDAHQLAEVRRLVDRFLEGRAELFQDRVERGCIRDGHGDLLADDIFCLPDGPRILDCLDFDDRLRYGDVLADVAFLVMDLERLGVPELAARFLDWYEEFGDGHHPASLAHYYVAARALVRSKVACVRATQGDLDAGDAAPALLQLALGHLRQSQARLVLVGGAPGTGKSTVAAALADRLGWIVLRSDEVRKDVTGVGRATPSRAEPDAGIYTPSITRSTYTELLARAERLLRAGESVILDATWSDASSRAAAARLARDAAAELVEVCCTAPPEVATARVHRRSEESVDVSDADVDVAREIRARFDPWPTARVLSTLEPVADVVDGALDLVVPTPRER